MSFSCTNNNPMSPDPRLLRVDVGVSRAFDNFDNFVINNFSTSTPQNQDRIISKAYRYFKSKLPQILEVDCTQTPTNTMQLRRTTIKNMLIHQPRDNINHHSNIDFKRSLLDFANIRNDQSGGNKIYNFINDFMNKLNI